MRHPESLEYYLLKTLKHIIFKKICENKNFIHPDYIPEEIVIRFPLETAGMEELEENLGILQKELRTIDTKKRELLFLKFNTGLTYNEIGKLLGIKPDTVKKQVYRILGYLQVRLRKKIINLFVLIFSW